MSKKTLSNELLGGKAKRVKLEETIPAKNGKDTSFVDGAIVRLAVKDFLTYSDCEYKFGPGLNVLLGPNGTGKSSVVCALCLGLAGPQQLLGRAREVGDFVRHGQDEAWIHVVVFREAGNVTFSRHIKRENNTSHWKVNGEASTLKKVQEFVKQLNIQLGNLCQFLPQDRVVDFARLSPPDLLKATEQAVGNPSMYDDHLKLIELHKEEKELQDKAGRNHGELDRLKHQNSLLDRDVQRYQERQQFMVKVKDLESKRPWVVYEEVRAEFAEAHQHMRDAKQELERLKQIHAPTKLQLEQAQESRSTYEKQSKDTAKLVANASKSCTKVSDELDVLEDEMSEPARRLETARKSEVDRQTKISQTEQVIRQYEQDLEQVPLPEVLKPQLQETTKRLRDVNAHVMRLQQHQTAIREEQDPQAKEIGRLDTELQRLDDVRNRRLQLLRQADRDTYNAVQWLRSNRDRFKQEVYEPVVLVVNMKKAEDARYLEQIVGFRTLISFVCQSDDDLKLFCELVRDQQNLRINAAAAPDTSLEEFRRKGLSLANVKQRFDFRSSLLDMVEGPEVVLRYLCRRHRIHETLIGTDRTEANIDKVIQESQLTMFCTPKSFYVIKTSKYGQHHKSTQVNDIKPGRFLNVAVDTQRREQILHELQDVRSSMEKGRLEIERLKEEERRLRTENANLKKQKDDLQAKKESRRSIETQLSMARQRHQRYVQSSVDINQVEADVKVSLEQINHKRAEAAKMLKSSIKKLMNLSKEKTFLDLRTMQEMLLEDRLQAEYRAVSSGLKEAEDEFKGIERKAKELKAQAKEKHRLAQQMLGTNEAKPSADVIAVFNNYPSTLAEIDDMIHDLRTRADLNYFTDPKIVEEYEKRKAEIEKVELALRGEQGTLEGLKTEIEAVKDRWLKPLRNLVGKIAGQYSEFFSRLGCNGTVELEEPEDYDKYAIRILVKFHASQKLHVLTAQHQSGGERSVSTMLYLMALQELTRCPFRLVDEINQGMDPNNERRVFEFVVASACRPGTSQYFLITPKLLTNLQYNANMKVHCIYSGTGVDKSGQSGGTFCPRRLVDSMRR